MAETCENCYSLVDWLDDDNLCEWCTSEEEEDE